jgi:hypothetical protein
MKKFFILLILLTSFATIRGENYPFRFVVNFGEFANLTYHLDCLNNLAYCTASDYQALWEKEFLNTDADKKMLENWGNLRNRYQNFFELDENLKFPIDRRVAAFNLGTKIQIAGLRSKNIDEYLSQMDLLVIHFERKDFAKVIKHFQPRFSAWWKKEAEMKGTKFAKEMEKLFLSNEIKTNIFKFYNFYQPNLPKDYPVTFNLFYRPQLKNDGASGQALDNQLLVEFFPNQKPRQRIDVVLHEFCHFMFSSIPLEKHLELQNIFIKSGRESSFPAFGLLNEALASAFGNGIITRSFLTSENWKKYLETERSFYNNQNIDQASKAILPVLDDWLSKGGKLNDENFVKLYLDTLEKSFGEKLTSPNLYLGQAYLFLDEPFAPSLRQLIRQTLNSNSLFSEQNSLEKASLNAYFNQPNLSSVFVVQPKNLKQLVNRKVISNERFEELQKIYETDKNLLFSFKRNLNSYTFIVVTEDNETVKKLIQDLANSPKSFVGKFISKNF